MGLLSINTPKIVSSFLFSMIFPTNGDVAMKWHFPGFSKILFPWNQVVAKLKSNLRFWFILFIVLLQQGSAFRAYSNDLLRAVPALLPFRGVWPSKSPKFGKMMGENPPLDFFTGLSCPFWLYHTHALIF